MWAMADLSTEQLCLSKEFPPVSTEEWEAVIRADLAGADYEKKLIWRTDEGIAVKPYYRLEDAKDLPGLSNISFEAPETDGMIDAAQFGENGATTVQELAYGLAAAQEKLAAGIEATSIGLVFSAGVNFFFEIAKLRAARLLWHELTKKSLYIEARTSLTDKSIYDPYTNLLRATTEAMSALIGGAAEVNVQPFGFRERLAENVDHILREEARLDDVIDPAAGSWYVEVLTASIADEARKLVRQIAEEGGYTKGKPSIEQAIAQARAAKEKAVAQRRRVLVGVNNYPDITEAKDPSDLPPLPSGVWRAPAPFEAIRLRADIHAKQTGHRPTVLLLMRGDLKMRQARAQFCQNLFGCGGFAIIQSDELDPAADVVVLCSSDPEYPKLAADILPQTGKPVVVAGKEQDIPGVAGFVNMQSDVLKTLEYWLERAQ